MPAQILTLNKISTMKHTNFIFIEAKDFTKSRCFLSSYKQKLNILIIILYYNKSYINK